MTPRVRRCARAVALALLAAATLPLGGCAVSLFSRSAPTERLDRLEHRMDVVEQHLGAR